MTSINTLITPQKDIPWRIIEEEALLVDVHQGEVVHLNKVGAEVWKVINEKKDEKTSIKELIDHICSEFEIDENTAEKDVLDFVNELVEKGLVGY